MEIPVTKPCPFLIEPRNPQYAQSIRQFQGCPTIAITPKGRIFMGWYSGGTKEPHMENYNLLVSSRDGGKTWSEPHLIIPSDIPTLVHALDIQLWVDPLGRLWVFWVQERVRIPLSPDDGLIVDGFSFGLDKVHGMWGAYCEDPDEDHLIWSEPRRLDDGFLRCRPTALSNGNWIFCNYDQNTEYYGYSITRDQGKSFQRYYGAEKLPTPFDESMILECKDGVLWMMARSNGGAIAQTFSYDMGKTWSKAEYSSFPNPSSRIYLGRTPAGSILLINNQATSSRINMTILLSQDEGKTWSSVLLDSREHVSYPDVDYYNGKIYLTYDRDRFGDGEIYLCIFSEQDILDGKVPKIQVVSHTGRVK